MLFPLQPCYPDDFLCFPTDVVIGVLLPNPKLALQSEQAGHSDGKYSLCSLTKPCVLAINSPHPTVSRFFGVLTPLHSAFGVSELTTMGGMAEKMKLSEMNGHGCHVEQCQR